MNERWFNNFMAVCLILLVLMAILFFTGCAGKGLKVDYLDPEGKAVTISTDYQIENGFTMERTPDGYKIDLGSATTKDAEMGFMVEMMRMVLALVAAQPGIVQPEPADPEE